MKQFLAIILILAVLGGGYYIRTSGILNSKASTKNSEPLDKIVRVATVNERVTGMILPLVGRVHASKSVEITPEVTARVLKVYATPTKNVTKGELLIELEHSKEEARFKEEEVRLTNFHRKLGLMQKLKKNGVISEDAFEQLEAQTAQQEAVLRASKAELEERKIYAPFSGILSLHQITAGQLVKPGNILLQLDDISTVYADFNIPEKYLSQIKVGQKLEAKTEAWPREKFSGKIVNIDSHVQSDTLAIKIRVSFANPKLKLLDGMMLELSLNLAADKYPVIPLRSITYQGEERYVFILNKNNTVSRRKIVLGPVNGNNTAVKEGLRAGMVVITEGIEKLQDGDLVKILEDKPALEDMPGDVPLKKKNRSEGNIL